MSQTATEPRTFSETELAALVADRVTRQTAEATKERDEAVARATAAENKLDAAVLAQKAAEDKAKAAEEALETQKLEAEKAAESATKKDARIKQIREVAKHITDETFFTDEARVKRVIAMDDDAFTGYLDDLKRAAGNATKDGGSTPATPPRETAMAGDVANVTTPTGKATASAAFLGRRFGAAEAASTTTT
ncbi:MAG TPA: hypothetical protein VII50_09955 [Acidothermaceae bacterium]